MLHLLQLAPGSLRREAVLQPPGCLSYRGACPDADFCVLFCVLKKYLILLVLSPAPLSLIAPRVARLWVESQLTTLLAGFETPLPGVSFVPQLVVGWSFLFSFNS